MEHSGTADYVFSSPSTLQSYLYHHTPASQILLTSSIWQLDINICTLVNILTHISAVQCTKEVVEIIVHNISTEQTKCLVKVL